MFYKLFNILYKITSKRGLKVFAFTCIIVFIISFLVGVNQVQAMSTEDLQYYGDTLTYWTNAYIYNNGMYLTYEHNNQTQSASSSLFQLKYYNGSDRDHNLLVKLSPGYIYAIHDVNPNSSSTYAYAGYYFFLENIDNLPMNSSDPALDVVGKELVVRKNGYTYIMGADKWLLFIPNISSTNCLPEILQSTYPVLQTGGSSGGGGSSIDYTSLLQDTINELQDVNTTLNLIENDTSTINTSVTAILNILQNSGTTSITNAINTQTQQQEQNFNTITNTTTYDNTVTTIDTSSFQSQDVNGVDNFLLAWYGALESLSNNLQTSNSVSLVFPLPFTNKTINVSTAPIQQFYADNTGLADLISVFWYVVFGGWLFRLAYFIWVSVSTGAILSDTSGTLTMIDQYSIIKDFMV